MASLGQYGGDGRTLDRKVVYSTNLSWNESSSIHLQIFNFLLKENHFLQ